MAGGYLDNQGTFLKQTNKSSFTKVPGVAGTANPI